MKTATLLLLAACSTPPPSVTQVAPDVGPAGTAIVVTGADFGPGTTAKLGGKPLVEAVRVDEQTLRGAVPADLKAGPVALVVTDNQGRSSTLPGAFTVEVPAAEIADPCSEDVKLFTHIPPTADVVKIDLHLPGGEVDRQQIAVRDLQHVEYEARLQGDALCTSIWMRTKRGTRHLFDADDKVPLRGQAQRIANGLSKPVEVVHEDALPADTE